MTKLFIEANDLFLNSFKLAKKILDSGFKPDFIIAIWRGGTPIGICIQEYFKYKNIKTDHIAIRTSGYDHDKIRDTISVHGLDYLIKNINAEDNLLIIDDVFETGLSVKAVLDKLKRQARKNTPKNIKIATIYFKPSKNKTDFKPDYYMFATDQWLVFPHEMEGCTKEEIINHKGEDMEEIL